MENIPNTAVPQSKHRWLWFVLAGMVLVLFALGGYLAVTSLPALYSPPDRVRSNTDYKKKMNPPKVQFVDAAALPTKPAIVISTNNGKVRLEYAVTNQSDKGLLPMTVHRLEGTNVVTVSGASVRIKHIGLAWLDPGQYQTNSYSQAVQGSFFHPNLQPLTMGEVTNAYPHAWERSISCEPGYPSYRFVFDIGPGAYQFLGIQIFDARTHSTLTQGWSAQNNQAKELMVTSRAAFVREAPVEVVLDLALGQPEIEEILPVTGASFRYGNSMHYLIYAGECAQNPSWSSSSDAFKERIDYPLPTPGQKKPYSAYIFMGVPMTSYYGLEFQYLDQKGQWLATSSGGSSGNHIFHALPFAAADVKKIKVIKHLEAHRFVFHLLHLPGVLPGNEKVENLFNVRIPFVAFKRNYEQANYVQNMAQVDLASGMYNSVPSSSYPRLFTNTTPAEILADYEKLLNLKGELYVNQEKLRIEERQPLYLQAWSKVRSFWKKIKGP